jgi:hypothetical protein
VENKKHIGTFHSIDTLLYKITELTAQGYKDNDMYAITNIEDNVSLLRGQADAEFRGVATENWLNRFKLLLSGEKTVLDALVGMGFSKQQSQVYYEGVKAGGIALFVDARNPIQSSEQLLDESEVISEMDSSVEWGPSGEQLDGQDASQQIIDNAVPRIDTRNL